VGYPYSFLFSPKEKISGTVDKSHDVAILATEEQQPRARRNLQNGFNPGFTGSILLGLESSSSSMQKLKSLLAETKVEDIADEHVTPQRNPQTHELFLRERETEACKADVRFKIGNERAVIKLETYERIGDKADLQGPPDLILMPMHTLHFSWIWYKEFVCVDGIGGTVYGTMPNTWEFIGGVFF